MCKGTTENEKSMYVYNIIINWFQIKVCRLYYITLGQWLFLFEWQFWFNINFWKDLGLNFFLKELYI